MAEQPPEVPPVVPPVVDPPVVVPTLVPVEVPLVVVPPAAGCSCTTVIAYAGTVWFVAVPVVAEVIEVAFLA